MTDIVERLRQAAQPFPDEGDERAALFRAALFLEAADEIERLKAFAKAILKYTWDADIDGGIVQDLAEEHGLIAPEIYDEARHGESFDAVPGEDTIYVYNDWMKG